jgi:hypothetical protein
MPGRRSTRNGAALLPCIAAAAAVALALAACSSSGDQYVENSDDRTYFKVPGGWKLYSEETLIEQNDELSEEQREQVLSSSWRTAFDASPDPDVQHLFATDSSFPTGFALVDQLSQEATDTVSDQVLRNQFIPVDAAGDAGQLEMLSYENVNQGDGFHGIRFRARISSMPESEVYPEGPAFTFEQVSLVDQARERSYSLIVMCSSRCFEKHTSRIHGVVDSWTVEES